MNPESSQVQSESVLTHRVSLFRNHLQDMEVLTIRFDSHALRLAGIVSPPQEASSGVTSAISFADDLSILLEQFASLNTRVGETLNRLDEYI